MVSPKIVMSTLIGYKRKIERKMCAFYVRIPLVSVLIIAGLATSVISIIYGDIKLSHLIAENPLEKANIATEVVDAVETYYLERVRILINYMIMVISGISVLFTTVLVADHNARRCNLCSYRPRKDYSEE